MDHGQLEREARIMAQLQLGGADLCDNLPSAEALTAQTRNLNETNVLAQIQSLSPSQNGRREGGFIQKASVNNYGKDMDEQPGKENEEDDTDEVMNDEEEEEESEGSSFLIRCQSPDTPMTDSSFSETGSLLETPYPFSPGTSPEPPSPVIPAASPQAAYPTSQVEPSQTDVKVDSDNTESVASTTGSFTLGPTFTTGPIESTTLTASSDVGPTSPPGPVCITEATDRIAKNTTFTADHVTSSTEPIFSYGPTCAEGFSSSYAGPITLTGETFTVTACNASNATAGPLTFTTGPTAISTEATATTGPVFSNWEHITSTPTGFSTCTTTPIPALLECLEELAQRGDDTHLPQYLHQIAEAFVHHADYQRALWCIKLQRLYHQRVLDNLNALQQQWESQSKRSSSDLATQHLDTLKYICQTHSRPGPRDAECASLDLLRPTFEEGGALPSCTSVHQVDKGMEQRAQHSSHPVAPSIKLTDRLTSPEISEKAREDLDREVEGRDGFHGDQLTDKQGNNREREEAEGGLEYTISVIGNGLHPPSAGEMDQSKPAEQQGGDLGPAQEKEARKGEEERDTEEAAKALEMEEEGEEEEEERWKERDSPLSQEALSVETLASGAEVEVQQLHQEALAEETLYQKSQEASLPQQELFDEWKEEEEEEEEEEEYQYEVELDIIREAASLDDLAKLITVEEISPASGLVSILKKQHIYVDSVSVSASQEQRIEKTPAKRRVRFKVPDDGYEQDVGGGDSCLLLFLLCLVTVVVSVGGTALYCALGDSHSSVCQDFSRNADFYLGQIQSGIAHIQHWFASGS